MRVQISAVGIALPENERSSADVERRIMERSNGIAIIPRTVEAITGIRTRRYVDDDVNASDLGVIACRAALAQAGITTDAIDLLVWASASQDVVEPATAHITQQKLGTHATVMDVKNACNSFLNGVQVAEALILTGQYRRALIVSGETPSKSVKWAISDRKDLRLSFPGYTFGDAGAAVVLEPATGERGIFYRKFAAYSQHWDIGMLPGGGSLHPRGDEFSYFRGDGTKLKDVFMGLGPDFLNEALRTTETSLDDYARILIHQVTLPFLNLFIKTCRIPANKVIVTVPHLGNMASASLPVGLALAQERGEVKPGDRVLLIGLAGGISLGIMAVTL